MQSPNITPSVFLKPFWGVITKHTTHAFGMCVSVMLSMFTDPCSYHHCQNLESLQSPVEAVSETTSSHFLFPCTLTTADLPVLDSSFKLTHTTCDLLETLNVTSIMLSKKWQTLKESVSVLLDVYISFQ